MPNPQYPVGYLDLSPSDQFVQPNTLIDIDVEVECAEEYRRQYGGATDMERRENAVHCMVTNVVDSYYHLGYRSAIIECLTDRPRRVQGKRLYAVANLNADSSGRRADNDAIVSYVVAIGGRHGTTSGGGSWANLEVSIIDNANGAVRATLAPFRVETSISPAPAGPGVHRVDTSNLPEDRLMRRHAALVVRSIADVVGRGHGAASSTGQPNFSGLEARIVKSGNIGQIRPARRTMSRRGRASFRLQCGNPGTSGRRRNTAQGSITAYAYHGNQLIYRSYTLPIAVLGD